MSEASQVSRPTLRAINALPNAKAVKVYGSAFTEVGTPDIDAVVDGVPYKLEAKLPGKVAGKIQKKRLREWHEAGAVVGVIYSRAEAMAVIEGDEKARKTVLDRIF